MFNLPFTTDRLNTCPTADSLMRRIRYLCLIGAIAFAVTVAVTVAIADDPPAASKAAVPKPSPDEIEQWIRDLNAPEFMRREAATRQLIATGSDAAELLVKAAPSSSLEATCRIMVILRTWYTSGKDELVEPAETAIEQLAQSKNRHMAVRSAAILDQYRLTIRQDRAIAEIQKLGGQVKYLEARMQLRGTDEPEFMVILGRQWNGGDEGLKYVRRLFSINALYLTHDRKTQKITTPGITADGLAALQREMPQLRVQYRGSAFLGITQDPRLTLCRVFNIEPKSPADVAQLERGDVIIRFNDQPVADFEALIDFIKDKQPGDVIKLEVLRSADENELEALDRLKGPPESDAAKEYREKLRERLGKKIDVTLVEWGAKPQP